MHHRKRPLKLDFFVVVVAAVVAAVVVVVVVVSSVGAFLFIDIPSPPRRLFSALTVITPPLIYLYWQFI